MLKKCLAEAIGTFAITFAGTGAIVANEFSNGAVSHTGIALTFGLVVMTSIYALAEVSGAHFNPAVTLGFLCLRKISIFSAATYVLSQLGGALAGSATLALIAQPHGNLGQTLPQISSTGAFTLEAILTFFLMFVILQVTKLGSTLPNYAALAIGSTVALDALFGGPFTGASMNPARSIAPAIVTGNLSALWIYIAGPLAGAIGAVLVARYLLTTTE